MSAKSYCDYEMQFTLKTPPKNKVLSSLAGGSDIRRQHKNVSNNSPFPDFVFNSFTVSPIVLLFFELSTPSINSFNEFTNSLAFSVSFKPSSGLSCFGYRISSWMTERSLSIKALISISGPLSPQISSSMLLKRSRMS